MRNHLNKIASFTALVLISSLSSPVDVFADDEKKQRSPALSLEKNASTTSQEILTEKEQKIIPEASNALFGTQQAISALEVNEPKKAISILRAVSGKLAIILAKNPGLAFIPANVVSDIYDFQGDAKIIEEARDKADDFLEDGNFQGARQILAGLASEVRITTTSIPLGSFPAAIKEAKALIETGKTNEAVNHLNKLLNLLIETTEIIPLPILRAEALLDQASELEHKQSLAKEKSREDVLKLTDAAKDKLILAELLGYGPKEAYKTLYAEIDLIKEMLDTEKSSVAWDKIKRMLAELKRKVIQTKK